jgi:hypothetical protein
MRGSGHLLAVLPRQAGCSQSKAERRAGFELEVAAFRPSRLTG